MEFFIYAANLLSLGHGAIVGWVSPALATLTHDSTPLKTGPLTNEQVSWIGSINTFGGVFGTLVTGYLASVFGCKRSMLFLAVPSITFWTIIHFGDTYYHILVARAISGKNRINRNCVGFLFMRLRFIQPIRVSPLHLFILTFLNILSIFILKKKGFTGGGIMATLVLYISEISNDE